MKRILVLLLTILLGLDCILAFGSKEEHPSSLNPSPHSPQDQESLFSQRIVSLVPSVTETLFALQAQDMIVARTDFCNWPPEAQAIPSVGGFDGKTISLERIVAFQPDLVCIADVMHNHLIQPLEALGIKVFLSTAQKLDQIHEGIVQDFRVDPWQL